jgi:4-hydroxybenzoate polyprenyltransferase
MLLSARQSGKDMNYLHHYSRLAMKRIALKQRQKWYTQPCTLMETPLKNTLTGLAKLTRFNEYVYFVVITTMLGIAAAEGAFQWRLIVLLVANWLAVSFGFMINDIEDAPDDAFSEKNYNRNPVSSGLILPRTAWVATLSIGIISASLFAIAGFWPFVFGMVNLTLGLLFSIKSVQLKMVAVVDLLAHGLLLAGLPFLSAFSAFSPALNRTWIWPFIFVMCISIYYELHDEIQDYSRERPSRRRQTTLLLGEKTTNSLMTALVILGVFSGVLSFFWINLIPAWVLLVMLVLVIALVSPTLMRSQRDKSSRNSVLGLIKRQVELAAALALILNFLIPWLAEMF